MKTKSDLADEIFDYATVLSVMLAGPDAETAIDGMQRLALDLREKAEQLREALNPAVRCC